MDESKKEKIILPEVEGVGVFGRSVLVRADLDLPTGRRGGRWQATEDMVSYLKRRGVERIKVIGHKGDISMVGKLNIDINWDLRADPREEENSVELAQELAQGFDVYVNEAFAVSHRRHTSIVALPEFMKSQGKIVCVGLRFEKEITHLSIPSLYQREGKGRVLVIGGAKGDKEKYAEDFEKKGWTVLRGGLLPNIKLRSDGLDISDELIANYIRQLADLKPQTIVVAGPMGKYQEAPEGTREVFTAVANSKAYKVAGGGDTEAALEEFGLTDKFDWISVGGGAMLEFLATGTLPGIDALL